MGSTSNWTVNFAGRQMRIVDALEWDLTAMRDQSRMHRLNSAPEPEALIISVADQAKRWGSSGHVSWDPGKNGMVGHRRAKAVLPLTAETFDALINGRSGYRAQYYLSCLEGAAFNLSLVAALLPALEAALEGDEDQGAKRWSLCGPWSKIWVYGDSAPFMEAPAGEFQPRRWIQESPASVWLRAPLPAEPAIDIKGTWISDPGGRHKLDPDKADRDCCLHDKGFA